METQDGSLRPGAEIALRAYREALPKYRPPAPSSDGRPPERFYRSGWLLPYLLHFDSAVWGRWDYWIAAMEAGRAPGGPIPRIGFGGHRGARAHMERCLDMVPGHGSYRGWSAATHFDFFLDFLLFGFGAIAAPPPEPFGCEGASARLYAGFVLQWPLAYPHDYLGDIFAESNYGRHMGFFPTPMTVTECMVAMVPPSAKETVNDPCVGTGRMLLSASNHSLRLSGCDINPLMVKATVVNGFMYAPWLARPFQGSFFPAGATAPAEASPAGAATPVAANGDRPGKAARRRGGRTAAAPDGAARVRVRDLPSDPEMARRAILAFPPLAQIAGRPADAPG